MLVLPTGYDQDEINKMAKRRGVAGVRIQLRLRLSAAGGPRWARVRARFVRVFYTKDEGLIFFFNSAQYVMNAPEDVLKGLGLKRPRLKMYRPSLLKVPAASVRFVRPNDGMRSFLEFFELKYLIWRQRRPKRKMTATVQNAKEVKIERTTSSPDASAP